MLAVLHGKAGKVGVFLVWLACAGRGRRLQTSAEELHKLRTEVNWTRGGKSRANPLQSLARLLVKCDPIAAFIRSPVANGRLAPASPKAPRLRVGNPKLVTNSGVEICEFTRNAIEGNNEEHDILLRAAQGEVTKRPAVWLMRQAGRYMAAFREYSEKYPFRERSETADMAVKLSLQPWHAFGTDGVIMFSDILTPLPAFGIDFDVVRGKGPVITTPMDTAEEIEEVITPELKDFKEKTPFIKDILGRLKKETEGATTLVGFVGAPWTLAAYCIEGGGTKNALKTHKIMMHEKLAMTHLMEKFAEGIALYAAYQVSCGAQVIQVFESWAHHLSPANFEFWAKPYAQLCLRKIRAECPDTPIIYFANGGSSYLNLQQDMMSDMLCIDWGIDLADARDILGPGRGVSGNVDPRILFGSEIQIRQAVLDCAKKAKGAPFVLNVGHGVMQGTPEKNVGIFVDQARQSYYDSLPDVIWPQPQFQ